MTPSLSICFIIGKDFVIVITIIIFFVSIRRINPPWANGHYHQNPPLGLISELCQFSCSQVPQPTCFWKTCWGTWPVFLQRKMHFGQFEFSNEWIQVNGFPFILNATMLNCGRSVNLCWFPESRPIANWDQTAGAVGGRTTQPAANPPGNDQQAMIDWKIESEPCCGLSLG